MSFNSSWHIFYQQDQLPWLGLRDSTFGNIKTSCPTIKFVKLNPWTSKNWCSDDYSNLQKEIVNVPYIYLSEIYTLN